MELNVLYLTPSGLFIRISARFLSTSELFYARTLEPEPREFILNRDGTTAVMPGDDYAAIRRVNYDT